MCNERAAEWQMCVERVDREREREREIEWREVNWIVHVGLCRCVVLVPTTCSICLAVRCTVAVWFDFQNVKYIKRSFARGNGGRAGQGSARQRGWQV